MNTDVIKSRENLDLVWKHTHPDFKGSNESDRCVMWYENGSTLGKIENMPDDIFRKKLKSAFRSELCERRDKKLRPLYERFGLIHMFEQTQQFREDFETVVKVFEHIDGGIAISNAMRDEFIVFPDGPDSDGFELPEGVKEKSVPVRGMLEVLVQRPGSKVLRFFECNMVTLQVMYKQAISNPYVCSYRIL